MCLYGGNESDRLDKLRHIKIVQKVTTTSSPVQATTLPPTSAAAKFSSLRASVLPSLGLDTTENSHVSADESSESACVTQSSGTTVARVSLRPRVL